MLPLEPTRQIILALDQEGTSLLQVPSPMATGVRVQHFPRGSDEGVDAGVGFAVSHTSAVCKRGIPVIGTNVTSGYWSFRVRVNEPVPVRNTYPPRVV